MEQNKELLIKIFEEKVKGKFSDITGRNVKHDGREGHWLEEQFGKHHDADNHADFFGYELKTKLQVKLRLGIGPQTNIYSKIIILRKYFTRKPRQKIRIFFVKYLVNRILKRIIVTRGLVNHSLK